MPRTINRGFEDFHSSLTPSPGESQAAKDHRTSIEACLKSGFGLNRFFRTGSFGNGTSISGYSDVDYFASIPTAGLKQNSSSTLTAVRDALNARFYNTNVRVNCPAVYVPFGTLAKDATEVVPADYVSQTDGGYSLYDIPDCHGGWMRSSPETHNAYVAVVDTKVKGKLKPLIRFVKGWKFYCNVPISSFYLELRTAKYAEGEKTIVYDIDVKNLFKHLVDIDLAKMQDPAGISGYIVPCSTNVMLQDAKSKLSTAYNRATKARDAESAGDTKTAFYWWNLLYADNFPAYYL